MLAGVGSVIHQVAAIMGALVPAAIGVVAAMRATRAFHAAEEASGKLDELLGAGKEHPDDG
jgi:hypothetical protein